MTDNRFLKLGVLITVVMFAGPLALHAGWCIGRAVVKPFRELRAIPKRTHCETFPDKSGVPTQYACVR